MAVGELAEIVVAFQSKFNLTDRVGTATIKLIEFLIGTPLHALQDVRTAQTWMQALNARAISQYAVCVNDCDDFRLTECDGESFPLEDNTCKNGHEWRKGRFSVLSPSADYRVTETYRNTPYHFVQFLDDAWFEDDEQIV